MSYTAPLEMSQSSGISSGGYTAPLELNPQKSLGNPNITAALNYITPSSLNDSTSQRADSVLQNIGGELSGLTKSSSGISGLIDPEMAQNMVNDPTSMIQNYLTTTMGIPPELLNKVMMNQGAIPQMQEQQNSSPSYVSDLESTLKSAGAGLVHGMLSGRGAYPMAAQLASNYQDPDRLSYQNVLPYSRLNVPKNELTKGAYDTGEYAPLVATVLGLGKAGLGALKTASLGRAIQSLGELPEEPIKPMEPSDVVATRDGLESAINLNTARQSLENSHGKNGIHGIINKSFLKTYDEGRSRFQVPLKVHGDKIPEFLRPGEQTEIDTTKPFSFGGKNFSPFALQSMKINKPEDFKFLQDQYNKSIGGDKTPVEKWLGNDDFNLANTYAKKQLISANKNPSIKNNYELKEEIDRMANKAPTYPERANLKALSSRINSEGIISPLKELDQKYSTNTLQPYLSADNFWRESVSPYRANKTLQNISEGRDTSTPLDKVSGAIDKASIAASKYRRDPVTGVPLSQMPADHPLTTIIKPKIDGLYGDLNDAQSRYQSAKDSQSFQKKFNQDQYTQALQKYKENTKAYQAAMNQRQKQIENIQNAPTMLQKYGKKALYGAAGLSGLDYLRHLLP